ncbi:acyltransferase family protein [Paenibacillus sp. FSL R7-0312]|uniref:acyltransferase family protein n=1 Tax=Paenibacillus sp. FSL R7-0312 TaxID=2921682 RepID=UPI0030F5C5D6
MLKVIHLRSFFSEEAVNTGRQKELDIAKGLAVIFMIWQHILGVFEVPTYGAFEDFAVSILGSPFAAPVFMFTMGMGITNSRKNHPSDLFSRGLHLFVIGFVLNVCRWIIPETIRTFIAGDAFNMTALHNFFMMDILQFAALAFIFIGIVKKLNIPSTAVIVIALICSLLGDIFLFKSDNFLIADIVGLIIPTNGNVTFPFVNWIIFVVSGFYFAHLYRYLKDKKGFFFKVTPLALAISLTYIAYCFIAKKGMFVDEHSFFFMTFTGMIFNIILVIGWIGLLYLLFNQTKGPVIAFMTGLSKNINSVYVIQWTIIGFLLTIFFISLSHFTEIILLVSILLTSYGLSFVWLTIKKSKKQLH